MVQRVEIITGKERRRRWGRTPTLELEEPDWQTGGMSSPEKIARIRIVLKDIEPAIWRRVEVPLGIHLKGLHDVIQAVFDWQDYHLFEFQVGDKRYGIPSPEWGDERKVLQAKSVKLAALVSKGIDHFDYTYDFGDNWEHAVAIDAVVDADPAVEYPRFLDGARRGPPEDVGGFPGFFDFVEAVVNPRHSDHRRMIEWYGGPYVPEDMDLINLRQRLGAIVKRRHDGKTARAKSTPKS